MQCQPFSEHCHLMNSGLPLVSLGLKQLLPKATRQCISEILCDSLDSSWCAHRRLCWILLRSFSSSYDVQSVCAWLIVSISLTTPILFVGSFFSVANVIQQAGCPVPEYIKGFQKLLRYVFEFTQSLLLGFYMCILASCLFGFFLLAFI